MYSRTRPGVGLGDAEFCMTFRFLTFQICMLCLPTSPKSDISRAVAGHGLEGSQFRHVYRFDQSACFTAVGLPLRTRLRAQRLKKCPDYDDGCLTLRWSHHPIARDTARYIIVHVAATHAAIVLPSCILASAFALIIDSGRFR